VVQKNRKNALLLYYVYFICFSTTQIQQTISGYYFMYLNEVCLVLFTKFYRKALLRIHILTESECTVVFNSRTNLRKSSKGHVFVGANVGHLIALY